MSHYAHASLSEQYDGFVWFDETRAVTPIATEVRTGEVRAGEVRAGEDDTYPFGL